MVVEWFLWLITYSFLGWLYESALCSIDQKKWINRGFLNGPVCPVYGVGALVSILFLDQRTDNIVVLFIVGMSLTCTVEYITALLLEKLFHAKWWDYSNHRFNFQGRISLWGALVFGALSVLLIKIIHPIVNGLIDQWPDWMQIALSLVIFIVLMLDLYVTVRHLLVLNSRLQEIQSAMNGFLNQYARRAGELKNTLLDKFEESEFYSDHIKTLFSLNRLQNTRIVRAFPKLRSIKYDDAWQKLKSILLSMDGKR